MESASLLWLVWIAAAVVVILAVAAVTLRARKRRATRLAAPTPRPPAADRLLHGLLATRARLAERLEAALRRVPGDGDRIVPELEEALVSADVGVRTAAELSERVRARVGHDANADAVRAALREEVEDILDAEPPPVPSARPWVVVILGVNGVGKTTTIGKLAALHAAAGRRVLLVAADTFRAGAGEQLAIWGERTGAEVVRQASGASPAAVVFDGMKAAVARGLDVVLVDTAGRLHTRANLVEELRKVERVIAREMPGAPHETYLVLDATTGQNAIAQARTFCDALRVTGAIVTKLDGTARGGVAIAVRRETGIPIRYVGVGEGVEDLRLFDAHEFAEALLGSGPSEAASRVSA